jgi:putative ABC transport system permease protein
LCRNILELMSMDASQPQSSLNLQNEGQRSGWRRLYTATWEAFMIAVDSIWTHRLRSVLTLLGIIIGVASVVTVGGAIEGMGSWVWQRLSSTLGSNTFIVSRFARMNISDEDYEIVIKRNKNLYPEDMRAVEEKCVDCEAISPMIRGTDTVKRGNRIFYDARISGVNSDLPKIQTLDLAEGRFVSNFDVAHSNTIAVIGSKIREELFGPVEAIGKEIKVGEDSFTVIGVEVQNGTMAGQSLDANVYIPYTSYLKKYGLRRSIQFQVRAPSSETIDYAQDEVRQILRSRHKLKPNKEDDFDILASSAIQGFVDQIIGYIAKAIIPITLVSLVVGGIVIMNIMLVTVTERTVEIGTRKAVGAKRSDILLQFLIESALLASVGGILGLLLAYLLSAIIASTVGFPMQITRMYILMAVFTSGGVGLVSGIYPAYKASKLSPIVALMRE